MYSYAVAPGKFTVNVPIIPAVKFFMGNIAGTVADGRRKENTRDMHIREMRTWKHLDGAAALRAFIRRKSVTVVYIAQHRFYRLNVRTRGR